MDEEITGPKSVLFNISAQRNPPSFIFRLPTETLEAIFIHGACDYHSEASGHAIASAPSWVNVSYVCRHWRSVALHCATLWTYLFLTSPRWTNELLARSKQAPLKLHVNMSYVGVSFKVGLYSLDQVMKHVERVQECHISLPLVPVMQENWLVSKLSSPAPRLQHLTISVPDVPWEWQLPSELFDGDTPALRTLELIGCRVAWYSLQLSGLTTLSLCRVPARFHQNTGDLLATLRCMQDLTHLCLDHALASAAGFLSSAAFHTFQKINLPHLSRFWIAAPLSTVNALLSCINIPLKTEVRLECHFEHGSSLDDYAMFSSLLAKRFNVSAQSSPTICSLAVKQWSEMAKLTFSGSKLDDPAVSVMQMDWDCRIPLQIIVHFGRSIPLSNTWTGSDIVGDICCSTPGTDVQALHVINPPIVAPFWRKILGHLRNLRYLKLGEGWIPDLASVLSVPPHGYTENTGGYADRGPDLVLAPALEELELYDIDFSTPLESNRTSATDVQPLYDALSSRKESRGQLTVTRCLATIGSAVHLDMVGKWEDGHFLIVEECSRPYHSDSSGEDSDSDSGSLEDG